MMYPLRFPQNLGYNIVNMECACVWCLQKENTDYVGINADNQTLTLPFLSPLS